MPRTGRGGARVGRPGTAYSNRTDLTSAATQPIRTATDQPYGTAQAQANAQRQAPLPRQVIAPATPPAAPPAVAGAAGAPPPGPQIPPGALPPLDAPTQRPGEPVTSGLALGAGPGPEALGGTAGGGDLDRLRAIYSRYPTEGLRDAIEELERGG